MQTPIPSWLDNVTLSIDPTLPIPKSPELRLIERDQEHSTYALIRQDVMDQLAGGAILGQIVRDYNDRHSQPIVASKLRSWLMNKDNEADFNTSLSLGTMAMMDEYIMIADAKDEPMVDVEHIKIRLKARDKHMGAFNKKLFGNDPGATGNTSGTINVNITQVESPYTKLDSPNTLTIDV